MPAERTEICFVRASTLNRNADPAAFLAPELRNHQTVRTTAGLIPTRSWARLRNDRQVLAGLLVRNNRTAGRVPLPRASSPVLPAQLFPPPRTAADLAMHEQRRIAEEPERIALNERICAAEASSEADPTNEEKALEFRYLIEDYAEHFGDFVPDAAIEPYIMRRNWATEHLDVLWTAAGANGCPFSNPGPIEAYMTAASHFHSTLGRPYQRVDGRAGELTEACQLLVTHMTLLDECRGGVEKEHRLLGQKEFLLTFVNPFPVHDPERARLDATVRQRVVAFRRGAPLSPTFNKPEVTFRFINRGWEQPGSVRCRKAYCRYRRLAARLAELQQHAERRERLFACVVKPLSRSPPLLSRPVPTYPRPRCASALKRNQTSRRAGASGAQSGSKRLFRFYHNDHTATSTTVTSPMNDISRRRELARIGRKSIDDQVEAHLQRSLYKEREGSVYCNVRVDLGTGRLEVKGGWTSDLERRQENYRSCESATQEILWIAAFECAEPKRVERLLHLELAKLGARLQPRLCPGCGTNHGEYFKYSAADGFEGVLEIIEAILAKLGVPVNKLTCTSIERWRHLLAKKEQKERSRGGNGVRTLQVPRASQQAPDKRLTSARQEPAYGIWMWMDVLLISVVDPLHQYEPEESWRTAECANFTTTDNNPSRPQKEMRDCGTVRERAMVYICKEVMTLKKKLSGGAHRAEMNEWAAPRFNCGAAHQWGVKRVGAAHSWGIKWVGQPSH
ncbi:hypothetical protein DFH08DRAFT_827940 [Mycena albidolilacea]|uniref:Bacteriophage T5 Orf172 DNA-binding domain-containing protein n=1 Tax=Mycena albidolilacea TaxID=1033008 RepID=A0AAD6YY29_9AGAR|nr:hypothetical protein DFH08DRAFT_827940 [Mycena albidolilacea]